jgi:hypothetical protein
MARQEPSTHKRKGASKGLEMFLNWTIIIICVLLIALAVRSWACKAARGEAAPIAAPPALALSACAPEPTRATPLPREMGRSDGEISASLPGATLPIGEGPSKAGQGVDLPA